MGHVVLYRSPVAESWGSLETFLALRLEVEMIINQKVKVLAKLLKKSGSGIWHCCMVLAIL
jgi:hypothetical protein